MWTYRRADVEPPALPICLRGELRPDLRVAVERDVVDDERALLAHRVDRQRARRVALRPKLVSLCREAEEGAADLRDGERAAQGVRRAALLLLLLGRGALVLLVLRLRLDVRDGEHQADATVPPINQPRQTPTPTAQERDVLLRPERPLERNLVQASSVLDLQPPTKKKHP